MRKHKPIVFDTTVKPTVWNFRNLEGQKFGFLTVVSFTGVRKQRSYWNCSCECGGTSVLTADTLASGKTQSCGCLQAAITVQRNKDMRIHGEAHSLEYKTWNAMKMRCFNPNNIKYHLYGAMGVKVCDRWANSFQNFLTDMGRRPTPRHTIDRYPDPNGNYEPGNCRWATYQEQRHNRRDNYQTNRSES